MAKSLIQAFNDEFTKQLSGAKNYQEAYDKASDEFKKKHDFEAFGSYDSFRKKRDRSKR